MDRGVAEDDAAEPRPRGASDGRVIDPRESRALFTNILLAKATWKWDDNGRAMLPVDHVVKTKVLLHQLTKDTANVELLPTIVRGATHAARRIINTFQRLHAQGEVMKRAGLPANEASRISQYHSKGSTQDTPSGSHLAHHEALQREPPPLITLESPPRSTMSGVYTLTSPWGSASSAGRSAGQLGDARGLQSPLAMYQAVLYATRAKASGARRPDDTYDAGRSASLLHSRHAVASCRGTLRETGTKAWGSSTWSFS